MGEDPTGPQADPGFDDAGVPTFESVREKIERRFETSVGAQELDSETPEGRGVEQQYEDRQRAAADRLEQIRRSMHQGEH
jgi:phage shock protein A